MADQVIEGVRTFVGSLIDLGRPERNIVVRHVFQIEIFGNFGATGEFLVFPLGRLLQFLNWISDSSKVLGIYLGHSLRL